MIKRTLEVGILGKADYGLTKSHVLGSDVQLAAVCFERSDSRTFA